MAPAPKPAKKPTAEKPRQRREPWRRAGLTWAQRVIKFIEGLTITSGMHAGRRFKLRPWQREIIERIYEVDVAGRRVKRHALISLPRKNGKSQLCAGLALAHLLGPELERRGQILSAAADRGQAAILYNEMRAMIFADSRLADRVIIRDFNKSIEDTETGSIYTALSADARKAHGLSPSFTVMDELAQWPSRDLYDALTTGGGARLDLVGERARRSDLQLFPIGLSAVEKDRQRNVQLRRRAVGWTFRSSTTTTCRTILSIEGSVRRACAFAGSVRNLVWSVAEPTARCRRTQGR